jgi:DNA-binding ferritin-like protein (Dps family)
MSRHRALVQVLGAVAYGELKAYEGARARAAAAGDPAERRAHRQVAAEELRHYKGFVRRLEALGADPERAMAPYRAQLDRYHAAAPADELADAVSSYLGEGIADDLLRWLRRVADTDTAAFIDGVLEDEAGHDAMAADELRRRLGGDPVRRVRSGLAALDMAARMARSGFAGRGLVPFRAFVELGRPAELIGAVVGGQVRRLARAGMLAA